MHFDDEDLPARRMTKSNLGNYTQGKQYLLPPISKTPALRDIEKERNRRFIEPKLSREQKKRLIPGIKPAYLQNRDNSNDSMKLYKSILDLE